MNDSHEDEVNFEPEEDLGDLGSAQAKLKKLKDELAKVKAERQEYLDGWQRCKADSINAKKEALVSGERASLRKMESFVEDLMPVLDGFDMAAGNPAWESVDAQWRSGIEQIRNHLLDVLERYGVKRCGKIGDMFDPAMHEAVQEVDDAPGEPQSIVRILRYGYRKGEYVLRPAQVVIKV